MRVASRRSLAMNRNTKHAAHCLSRQNILGRHDCDCQFPPWRIGPPPEPGFYLVTIAIDVHDDGNESRVVRLEHWNGERYTSIGGYSRAVAWMRLPPPISST